MIAPKGMLIMLNKAIPDHLNARDFGRLIDSASYKRTLLANTKLSTVLTEFPTVAEGIFKDSYVFEFLKLPKGTWGSYRV